MSDGYIWGNLVRSNNDNTLIDAAIGAAIDTHNDNPDAHLGDGQALQSHRAAEIIDHLAESVVNDKIRAGARTYAAIVGNEDGDDYDNLPDAVAYVWGLGGGSIKLRKGAYNVTQPLKVRYGVDIYGEGPAETTITCDFSDIFGPAYVFNFADQHDITTNTVPTIGTDEGSQVCWIDSPGTVLPEYLDGCYYDGIETEAGSDGYFTYNSGTEDLLLRDLAIESGTFEPTTFSLTVTCSTSADTVHINGWQLADNLVGYEGLTLKSDDTTIGVISEYLGDGDFKLSANAAITDDHALNPQVLGADGRMSIIQGVSIIAPTATAVFHSSQYLGRYFVRDCNIEPGIALLNRISYVPNTGSGGGRFEDCLITYNSSSVDDDYKAHTFDNCVFTYNNISSITAIGGENCKIYNCRFSRTGTTTGGLFTKVFLGTTFQDCLFDGMFKGTISSTGSYGMYGYWAGFIMRGCSMYSYGPSYTLGNILFNINDALITGNQISVGNYTYGLASSARRSVFANNIVNGTVATQPTQCYVGGNAIWT